MSPSHLSVESVREALREVKDPEIPVLSLIDLNVIRAIEVRGDVVIVEITPTFVGCPALDMMKAEIRERVLDLGAQEVTVRTTFHKPWTTDDLSEETREALRKFGIAPPARSAGSIPVTLELPVPCPFCGSAHTTLESPFGSTLCKQLFYCESCRQSFDRFKPL